jgi:hypothetical protein
LLLHASFQPEKSRCGIVAQVARFLVVHGQIILNQFKNYPVKAVQQCAFVSALQDRMRERSHSKLFMSKRKITAAMRIDRKANPMRNREPKSKPKPMTATATTFVKAIWADYFNAEAADKGVLLIQLLRCHLMCAAIARNWSLCYICSLCR